MKDEFLYWENILQKFENELSNIVDLKSKIDKELFNQVLTIFSEILNSFIKFSNNRDNWVKPFYTYQFTGMCVTVELKYEELKISFGFYENDFFLSTSLLNPKDLNKMSDSFWLNLLLLSNHGHLNIERDSNIEVYNGINIEKRYPSKSQIFNLIKDFFFLDLTEGRLVDIANLKVSWPRNTNWSDLILNGCYCFKLLYEINKEIMSKNSMKNEKGL